MTVDRRTLGLSVFTAAAVAGRSAEAAGAGACAPAITPASFQRYIDAFNRADEAVYGEYYHPDVTLVLGGRRELKGKQAIFDFYKVVRAGTKREIKVLKCIPTPTSMAVELESEFLALVDDPQFVEGLKKGDRRWQNTVVFYEMKDGKFFHIRSASFQSEIRRAKA
jgi:hypothetical protein